MGGGEVRGAAVGGSWINHDFAGGQRQSVVRKTGGVREGARGAKGREGRIRGNFSSRLPSHPSRLRGSLNVGERSAGASGFTGESPVPREAGGAVVLLGHGRDGRVTGWRSFGGSGGRPSGTSRGET